MIPFTLKNWAYLGQNSLLATKSYSFSTILCEVAFFKALQMFMIVTII